ncbi:MAG: D-sedoheptulose 7-phosphate isomerase [bacterium]
MENIQRIVNELNDSVETKKSIIDNPEIVKTISKIIDATIATFRNNGKIIFMGNGGSAADSQHLAAEFVSKFQMERKALPSISLTVNTSILTAIGNDYGYDYVFSRQVEALTKPEDLVIGISTSGNSKNVCLALEKAKTIGAKTVGLTGQKGGDIKNISDIALCVPSDSTPRIQEAHITIGHIICSLVESRLFTHNE